MKLAIDIYNKVIILDSTLEKNTSLIAGAQLVWQEMGVVLNFVEADVSLSPSLPN